MEFRRVLFRSISYDEMLELAGAGAQVMEGRSVEVAKKYGVVFEVRSTFSQAPGTRVHEEVRRMEDVVVSGIAFDRKQAKISIVDIPDRQGVAAKVFGALGKAGINVDMIIQSEALDKKNDISFTVSEGDVKKALTALRPVKKALEAGDLIATKNIGKIAVVGGRSGEHT